MSLKLLKLITVSFSLLGVSASPGSLRKKLIARDGAIHSKLWHSRPAGKCARLLFLPQNSAVSESCGSLKAAAPHLLGEAAFIAILYAAVIMRLLSKIR